MSKQHIKAKQFEFKFSSCFRILDKTKSSHECSWLSCFGNHMVRFPTKVWFKPGNQTDESQTLNFVSKRELANRWVPNFFVISIKFFLGLKIRVSFFLFFLYYLFCFLGGIFGFFRIFFLGFAICKPIWRMIATVVTCSM